MGEGEFAADEAPAPGDLDIVGRGVEVEAVPDRSTAEMACTTRPRRPKESDPRHMRSQSRSMASTGSPTTSSRRRCSTIQQAAGPPTLTTGADVTVRGLHLDDDVADPGRSAHRADLVTGVVAQRGGHRPVLPGSRPGDWRRGVGLGRPKRVGADEGPDVDDDGAIGRAAQANLGRAVDSYHRAPPRENPSCNVAIT